MLFIMPSPDITIATSLTAPLGCTCSKLLRWLCLAPLFWLSITAFTAEAGALLINPGAGVTALSRDQLNALFTLKLRQWPNQKRVQIFVLKDESVDYRNFVTSELGIFPYQLLRHWRRVNFSGRAAPPIFVSSISDLLQRLTITPGAIGYVPGEITSTELSRVQIIP